MTTNVATLKDRVEKWLKELGYPATQLGSDEVAAWRIMINHPQGSDHKMQLVGPKTADDAVVIATAANVSPEHLQGYERLEDGDRAAFLWDLKRTLNQVEVDYRLVGENGAPLPPGDCPKGYEVSVTRYADGLTKDEFSRMIGTVFKTWLNGVMVIQERLGGGNDGPTRRFDFKKLGL